MRAQFWTTGLPDTFVWAQGHQCRTNFCVPHSSGECWLNFFNAANIFVQEFTVHDAPAHQNVWWHKPKLLGAQGHRPKLVEWPHRWFFVAIDWLLISNDWPPISCDQFLATFGNIWSALNVLFLNTLTSLKIAALHFWQNMMHHHSSSLCANAKRPPFDVVTASEESQKMRSEIINQKNNPTIEVSWYEILNGVFAMCKITHHSPQWSLTMPPCAMCHRGPDVQHCGVQCTNNGRECGTRMPKVMTNVGESWHLF